MEPKLQESVPQSQTPIMTEGLPMLVKGALQRTYLEGDVFSQLSQSLRLLPATTTRPPVSLRMRRIGAPTAGDWSKVVESLSKTLTGCHRDDAFQLCYRLDYDGEDTAISLGIRTKNAAKYPAKEYLSNITSVFSEQTPGTVFEEFDAEPPVRDYFAPITGIPGLSDRSSCDLISSIIAAVGDKPFSILVTADAISSTDIESALFACRQMLSQAETLKSISVSEAENWAIQISRQQSTSETETITNTSSESSKSKGAVLALGGLSAAATVLGGPYLGSLILMAGGSMMSNYTTSTATAKAKGKTTGTGEAFTHGGNSSKTVNIANAHMAEVAEKLSRFAERLESAKVYGAWNTSVYIMADDEVVLDKVGLTVKGMTTGKDTLEPIRIHNFANIVCNENQVSTMLSRSVAPEWSIVIGKTPQVHPLGKAFSGLSTPLSSPELSQWFALPHDDISGVSVSPYIGGFSLSRSTKKKGMVDLGFSRSLSGIKVPYRLDVDSFVRHTFLTGMPRRGKSTTCRRILEQIREIKGVNFPFLIIEPAKTEYLEWALSQNAKSKTGKIKVFMPGYGQWRKKPLDELKINPFEVIWEDEKQHPDITGHIQNLAAIINASLPMQESLPLLMEEAIFRCYTDETYPVSSTGKTSEFYKWIPPKGYTHSKAAPFNNRIFPTFNTLVNVAQRVVQEKKYHSEANQGFMAALNTRIGAFLHPPKSETFLTDGKSSPGFWRNFFAHPMVINLSRVGSDDDKAFYMALILMFLYEYRQQEIEEIGYTNSLRHLLVIEEAHSLLRKSQRQGMAAMDPTGKAVSMFANMISEIGAFGQGVMIIDQSPSALDDSVVKNTNTKIIHRLGDGADIERMARAINLPIDRQQAISKLANGEVIISSEDDDRPSRVEVLPDSSVLSR